MNFFPNGMLGAISPEATIVHAPTLVKTLISLDPLRHVHVGGHKPDGCQLC